MFQVHSHASKCTLMFQVHSHVPSALSCSKCTLMFQVHSRHLSGVHLDYESALGCMRVHLELAMFPDPPPHAMGLGTRLCLILAHQKSISENRCLILDHRKSISENRFQILEYRKSSIGIRYPDIDLCYSNNRSLLFEQSISDNRILSILRCFEFCRNRCSIRSWVRSVLGTSRGSSALD